jgi:hypothetical protein
MVYSIAMQKFKGKYRIGSARLQHFDYGSHGWYFVTICTKNRECYFGDIIRVETQDFCVSTRPKRIIIKGIIITNRD